jgi:hypothetical protein
MKHDRREQLLTSNAFENFNGSASKQQPVSTFSRLTSGKKVSNKRTSVVNKSTRIMSPKKLSQNPSINDITYVASTSQLVGV